MANDRNSENSLLWNAYDRYWKNTPDMAFVKDIDGVYICASKAFAEMVGQKTPEDIVGKTDFEIFEDQDLAKRYAEDDARLFAGGVSLENYVEPITLKDGRPRYSVTSKYIIKDDAGKDAGIYGVGRDITAEYEAKELLDNQLYNEEEENRKYSQLLHAAERDSMTGLFNHDITLKYIKNFLENTDGQHALFIIDLDNFKMINDSFGHQHGDTVLVKVADVISNVFRTSDIIGRLGGDEFMVLMKSVPSEKIVRQRAEELISALQFSSICDNRKMELTASAGVVIFTIGCCEFEKLYSEADAALYQAKKDGRNRYSIFGAGSRECENTVSAPPVLESVSMVQLQTLMDYMDGGVVMGEVADEIKITYVSPSLYTTFGRSTDEFGQGGKDLMSIMLDEDRQEFREVLAEAIKNDEVFDYSFRVLHEGQYAWRHIRAKIIPESGDGIRRLVAVITEINEPQSINAKKPMRSARKAGASKHTYAIKNRQEYSSMGNDKLTGILGKQAFYQRVREILDAGTVRKLVIVRFDINRFKVYNDIRGIAAGDKLLKDIAAQMSACKETIRCCARIDADHFALLTEDDPRAIETSKESLEAWLADYSKGFGLTFTVGVYQIIDPEVEVSLMCDRALLALKSVKSGFDTKLAYYDDTLRQSLLEEQQLVGDMEAALANEEFVLYFQPQINYDNGALIGAEALVRWKHPERGILSPAVFIPLFEQNALITRLDEYVWERCCKYMKDWTERFPKTKAMTVSVSVNVSRVDIYDLKLCETLKALTQKYNLPASMLRLEITESAYMENPQQLISTVDELRKNGFIVEMDDFGSGYSSLNTLKDVNVDALKLDMKFLEECEDSSRGGNILNSIIRMAHWLKIPVISEGVETKSQADYLKSLGCIYMQGYYFARPMPVGDFEEILQRDSIVSADKYRNVSIEGMAAFWDSSAQTALLFNSFVGGAAITEYSNGALEASRINDNFCEVLGTDQEKFMPMHTNMFECFDEKNRAKFEKTLQEAIETGEECDCELQSLYGVGGVRRTWTRNRIKLLAKNGDSAILYISVEDITDRKRMEQEQQVDRERNYLLMKATGLAIFDYDYEADTLVYQLYLKDKGVQKRTLRHCMKHDFREELISLDSVRELKRIREECRDSRKSGEVEILVDLWGSGRRWFRLRYSGVKDQNGKINRLVAEADDIQDIKERAAFSADFRAALDNNAEYIYIVDPETFEIIYSNKAIQAYGGEDYVGKICYREFINREEPCEQCPVFNLRKEGEPGNGDIRMAQITRADGMPLISHASPLRWNGRDMAMISCVDLTAYRDSAPDK